MQLMKDRHTEHRYTLCNSQSYRFWKNILLRAIDLNKSTAIYETISLEF